MIGVCDIINKKKAISFVVIINHLPIALLVPIISFKKVKYKIGYPFNSVENG